MKKELKEIVVENTDQIEEEQETSLQANLLSFYLPERKQIQPQQEGVQLLTLYTITPLDWSKNNVNGNEYN